MSPLVTVETRKAFVVTVGGVRRKFWSRGPAYYAIAKEMLVAKYGHMDTAESWPGLDDDAFKVRRERYYAMFWRRSDQDWAPSDDGHFDVAHWTRYVRRVARRLRMRDERQAALAGEVQR